MAEKDAETRHWFTQACPVQLSTDEFSATVSAPTAHPNPGNAHVDALPTAAAAAPDAPHLQSHPDGEAAFIRAFVATRVVRATLRTRWKSEQGQKRVPTSMAGLERRWFAGRHTVAKAQKQAALLAPELERIGAADADLALVGTAAMFELAAQDARMVQIEPAAKARGCVEVRLAVASRRPGRPARSVPTVKSKPATNSEAGWSLISEDSGVFAYGVRRYLRQHGWTCPPWDDTGSGTCSKDWRSLVDNKRAQLGKRRKATPVVKTLRQDTIDKWDGRARQPGYTVALCNAVLAFRDATCREDTPDTAANEEPWRTYFVDETVAAACRQFAERVNSSPIAVAGPTLGVAVSEQCSADAQKTDLATVRVTVPPTAFGNFALGSVEFEIDSTLDNQSSSRSSNPSADLGDDLMAAPWGLDWANEPTWIEYDSGSDPESWPGANLLGTFETEDTHSLSGLAGESDSSDGSNAAGGDLAWSDIGGEDFSLHRQLDANSDHASSVDSSTDSEVLTDDLSSVSAFDWVIATNPPKRSLDEEWCQPNAAAADPPAKFQKTAASLSLSPAQARQGKLAATACFSAGAVALAFILSAGHILTHELPSIYPRVGPGSWHCVVDPNSVIAQWTENELCQSDPMATFSCQVESVLDPCMTRHGVLAGRICRCDGCYTGGECMMWEHRGADDESCEPTALAASSVGVESNTTCQCSGNGNEIKCSNGESRYCSWDQDCTAKTWDSFYYGDWSACKVTETWPQWRQQMNDDDYARRNSPAVMWMADNATLLLYLFASGSQCPAPTDPLMLSPGDLKDGEEASSKFTIGACPVEGVAREKSCLGEGNEGGFGDICTGGLYSYSVQSKQWTDFVTNKDFQVKEMFQFEVPREKFVPASRNDAVQWSERPMGGSGVFIFGGVGCPTEPFSGTDCMVANLVDLWYFDIHRMWFPLSGFSDDSLLVGQQAQGGWPEWQHGRAAWTSSANYSSGSQLAQSSGGELWMFGGLIREGAHLTGSTVGAGGPTAELWCYTYTDPHSLGSWTHVSTPSVAPPARYAATAWGRASTSSAAAYIYGGIAVEQGTNVPSEPGSTLVSRVLLEDLWSFNGDKDKPVFTKILPPQLSYPGATSWPPPGVANGWVRSQKLWLWTPPRVGLMENGTAAAATQAGSNSSRQLATLTRQALSNELWAFSIQLQQWERVGAGGGGGNETTPMAQEQQVHDHSLGARDSASGLHALTWPGSRDGALVADGFVFGGVGTSECGGGETSQQQSLGGLWRLTGRE